MERSDEVVFEFYLVAPVKKPAVFLDRDGTIVEDLDFLTDLADLRLLPTVASAIQKWNKAKVPVIVITNQSGVARGFLSEKTLREIHSRLAQMLAEKGARIDAFYYCPHHPTVGPPEYRKDCECRKPKAGMYRQAAAEHNIDLTKSYSIGDSLRDGQAAKAAGVTPFLVRTGPTRNLEEALEKSELFQGVFEDLNQAAEQIIQRLSAV